MLIADKHVTMDNVEQTQELFKHYLTEFTGLPDMVTKLHPISPKALYLPRLVIGCYDLYSTEILKQKFTWAFVKDKKIGIRQIRAHLEMLKKTIKQPVVFLFDELNGAQQHMLMSQKINFVVLNSTVFLPNAVIRLPKMNIEEKVAPMGLSIWATAAILFQLNTKKLNNKSISDFADIFKISKMHASRAVDELKAAGLVRINQKGAAKFLQFQDKKELWANALPYLANPVLKRIYTNDNIAGGRFAGYTALSEYTLIDGGEQKTKAIFKKQFLKATKNVEIKSTPAEFAKNCIEVWEWDPEILGDGKFADPLSLYLSMRDNADDRTQIALKEILENMLGKQ